ncbi:MAG: BamA/TamA family outer membrane protein [Prevotella sp.]|nr:BamA/TamA family outer membrane protein [Prevotella sp.]
MKVNLLIYSVLLLLLAGCSSTKSIPDGDQLYIGLDKIKYNAPEKGEHFTATQVELEAALATAPNASLFGSSSIRSPFPIGLWIWNEFAGSKDGIGKWLLNSFGSKPILMSWVNPELRASVAKEVLRAHGYFRGNVTHEILTQKNPKKAKIGYQINMGHLFTIDSLRYLYFPLAADSLINATKTEAKIKNGDAFDVSTLEAERARINVLLRNNGYYYYQPAYASYLADTVSVPGKVLLKFQQAGNIPEMAKRKWYIGTIDVDMRKQYMETLQDSVRRRRMTIHYNGKHSPVRASVIGNALRLRHRQAYSYADHEESVNRLTSSGLFSLVDFNFTPRDTTGLNDTLDLRLNCVFDKPYDFYVEGNLTGKTSNRFGPGIVVGLTKRNAFRGGELLDINLRGSYEWQTGHKAEGTKSRFNSYEYGFDVSLQYPRLVIPFASTFRQRLRRRSLRNNFFSTPTTTLKVSSDIISRANYFKRHIVSGEWTYNVQTSATSRHQFSPLIFSFEYMRSSTHAFDSIMELNPYLFYTMRDQFIPKMQYVYTYTSPTTYRNPIWWQTTVSEAGNILSLGYMAAGKKWGEKDKRMFRNPYVQFLKLETEFVKTWRLSEHSTLVAHLGGGVAWSYGNSSAAPYSEQFYVGGANSIRAFTARFIGPGSYHDPESAYIYYLDQTGDIKILANLEYRPRLFGNLYGALFLDAGNVWEMHGSYRTGSTFKLKDVPKEMALGTGIGLRYDLDFLVIRVDWGIGIHVPYKSGFYNMDSFGDSQSIHFAVGYPF